MKTELTEFMKTLNANKKNLTRQQYRAIKGQAFAGISEVRRKVCISCSTGGADN